MKQLEISFDIARRFQERPRAHNCEDSEFQDFVWDKLKEAGFNMTVPALVKYDHKKKVYRYLQKDQEEALGYKETDSGIIYKA